MKNIFLENKDLIISMNDHKIDGTGEKEATVDILHDCFLVNIRNFDKPTEPWHECSRLREDVEFWTELRRQIEEAKGAGELGDMKEEFFLSFRK